MRKIVKGGADKSYGIQVAKLAGLPENVIERAKEIAARLLANDITETVRQISVKGGGEQEAEQEPVQLSLFDMVHEDEIVTQLRELELNTFTPLEALNKLYELQDMVKNR